MKFISQSTIDFLRDLRANNHRDWFNANKDEYEKSKKEFESFINLLIPKVLEIDKSIQPLEAKECMFRIYRDTRFSPDKTPYKTNIGAFIANGGRKSVGPGYYVHIEPGDSFVAGGVYMPTPEMLKAIRTAIFEHTDEFKGIIGSKDFIKYLGEIMGERLKTAPKGFPKDFPDIDLLKYKSYSAWSRITDEEIVSDNYLDTVIKHCKTLFPFNRFLQKALDEGV